MPITPDQQTRRFAENEERVDKWVNSDSGYTSSEGEFVESIPSLSLRLESAVTGTIKTNVNRIVVDTTVVSNRNGFSVGPMSVDPGVTVTVQENAVYKII